MSQFDEKMAKYAEELEKLGIAFDAELLGKVAKGLGPSIYNQDAELVSSSQKTELESVKNNFCIKKLGVTDEPKIDSAIAAVIEKLGSSNRNKYRAIFYYLLVKELKAEAIY